MSYDQFVVRRSSDSMREMPARC